MAPTLSEEEIVTLQVLRDKGLSFREIAATLGVSEGTIRYHRKRRGQLDGRGKPRKAQALANVIDAWMLQHAGGPDEAEPVSSVLTRGQKSAGISHAECIGGRSREPSQARK
jgi:DNA-binding CsgD family transcriptional regulator